MSQKPSLPHPQEVYGFLSFENPEDFIRAGGPDPSCDTHARFVVAAMPAVYEDDERGVSNAAEAIDAFYELFLDEGWVVFVWDKTEKVGWRYCHVGPDWHKYLVFKDVNSAGARAYRQHGLNVNVRHTKRKATKKKATKRKATKKKATKRKATKRKATKRKATKRKATKKKATKRRSYETLTPVD